MKTHSDSSFDESKAISTLKELLESNGNIKAFFGENDKTPNHDGFFELVNSNTKQPKKQFIVQIKKINNLKLNMDGSYSYSFDTSFLFYVKEKVAESPAIVFIVELNTKKCFYKYLSDDYLMHLNFEDKEHITLRLNDYDQITDIGIFYKKLLKIANERNARFINKTSQQIEEMRLAVEWLNKTMEDIPFLKELIPNFWRFGIASSVGLSLKISTMGNESQKLSKQSANAFGLYLQCKNKLDYGVQEFGQQHYLKPTFDFTNTITPMKYAQDVFISLLENYFNLSTINPNYLSDMVLNEIVFSMLDKMAYTENYVLSKPNAVKTYYKNEETIEAAKNHMLKFFSYFVYIVNDNVPEKDIGRKQAFLNTLKGIQFNNCYCQ